MRTTIILIGLLFLVSCSGIKYIEHKADKGDITFCLYAVLHYTNQHNYSTDKKAQEKVIKYCKKGLAAKVDTTAYNPTMDYAEFYRELGKSPLTNKNEVYFYYKKGAENGDGESQWVTGLYYLDGKGGKINNDSALYWIKKTSNSGSYIYSAAAQEKLGDIFIEGKIAKADTMTAMYYYKKSCACNREYSSLLACEKVIEFYKKQGQTKDTTDLAIYKELARQLKPNIICSPVR